MSIRELFFKYRSFTPIPLIVAALILANSTWWSFVSGLLVACMGECLRIWAVRYAGSATRTTGRVGGDELVTTGPFAHVRNPLYLGNFLSSLGILVMAWPWMPWLLLIYLALFFIQYGSIITLEEDFLKKTFGKVYSDYFDSVPRFIPTFSPYKRGTRKPSSLTKALRTEKNTLQSFVAVSLAVLLRWLLL